MLSNKEKKVLKAAASEEPAVVQIGKLGVTNPLIDSARAALEARELIKIKVLNNAGLEVEATVQELADMLGAELVQVIGHNGVLFKKKKEKSKFAEIKG